MTAQLTNESNQASVEITTVEPSQTTVIETRSAATDTWRRVAETASDIIADLPAYVGQFIQKNRSLLIALGWVFAALLGLRVLSAVIGTITAIPLAAPLFELIGLVYSVWFVNRYLLTTGKRQELSQEISRFKQQILG